MKNWEYEALSRSVFPWAVGETEKQLGFSCLCHMRRLFFLLHASNFYAAAFMALKWEKSYGLIPRGLKFYFQVTIQNKYYIQANEYLSNFKIVCIIAAELFLRELVWWKSQSLAIQIFLLKPSCAPKGKILKMNNCNCPLLSSTYMSMLPSE